MKTNFTFFILLICFYASAQTHRFIYDVEYKKDSTSQITTKENYHLDISGDEVLYYTRDFFIADSLIVNNFPFPKDMKLNTSTIIKHKKGSSSFEEYDLLENTVLNLQTTDSQNFLLTSEKKQVKDLTLQKATTTWGGRNWIAWFSKEIPFQEGPYKFHGLPGLIVEITDDKDNYKFSLVRSENIKESTENQYIEMAYQMSIPVTWEKFKNTKIKFYESPINFIKNGIGSSKNNEFYLNDGTIVNPANSREVNDRLRNMIKQYNNPIELDKAIFYP
ncbi:GLPGLI family protein [Kaistella yonginensis]|uniref:GLPGLI family protein n=1 Tax=Kaistella yonginensis TaxID=658267 RepID=UPI0025B35370|nr:GLPGLI family protein [Kaistella yonginensis]MDN3606568.1 GLPGLI family protein [Kaistella yonginensis]